MRLTLNRYSRYSFTVFDLKRLEYAKVLRIIGKNCRSEYSRRILLSQKPTSDRKFLLDQCARLKELKGLTDAGVAVRFGTYRNTADMLKRAAVPESMLSSGELAGIRENIEAVIALKRQFSEMKEEAPLLAADIREVRVPLDVKEKIDRAIDEHENVADDASPKLRDIIEKINGLRREVEAVLEGYLHAPDAKQYLRDRHITVKDDRYVIPVKQGFRSRVPGVVHAFSGSEKTVFIEPFPVVEKNNSIRLLQREYEQEIRKILIALTKAVRKKSGDLQNIQEFLADFDILSAKAAFGQEFNCTLPEFSDTRELIIEEGRHPLLKESVVPVSFSCICDIKATVITGPNTGGKTVTLKMIGLFVLCAQSGIPIPAKIMRTGIFTSVFSDIGDEGSIEQSLSTFSGHIKNIRKIIADADEKSLVLVDELGAGTDPVEGGALGAAVLDYLVSHNILTVVTTHFSFIKMYAVENSAVQVASVEFDPKSCRPTYRLIMGIPGRSNALEIARHLGLEREILSKTADYLSEEDRSADAVLRRLSLLEGELKKREETLAQEESALRELTRMNRELGEKLTEKERFVSEEYENALAGMLSEYRKRLEAAVKEVREKAAERQAIKNAKEELQAVEKEFSEQVQSKSRPEEERVEEVMPDYGVGDYIRFHSDSGGDIEGKVLDLDGDRATVQAGSFRMSVERQNIYGSIKRAAASSEGSWDVSVSDRPGQYECDLRGMRYEEAMNELIRFLDSAVLNNLDTVYIIHGLGTGALRQGVQDTLKKFRFAREVEYARPEQGGFGCTIVKLKK